MQSVWQSKKLTVCFTPFQRKLALFAILFLYLAPKFGSQKCPFYFIARNYTFSQTCIYCSCTSECRSYIVEYSPFSIAKYLRVKLLDGIQILIVKRTTQNSDREADTLSVCLSVYWCATCYYEIVTDRYTSNKFI